MGSICDRLPCFISLNVRLARLIFTPCPPLSSRAFVLSSRPSIISDPPWLLLPCPSISSLPLLIKPVVSNRRAAVCLSSKLSTDRSLFASASPSHPIIHDKSFILGSIQQPIVSNYSSSLSFDPLTVDQPPCTVNPRRTIVTSPGCNFRRKGECN